MAAAAAAAAAGAAAAGAGAGADDCDRKSAVTPQPYPPSPWLEPTCVTGVLSSATVAYAEAFGGYTCSAFGDFIEAVHQRFRADFFRGRLTPDSDVEHWMGKGHKRPGIDMWFRRPTLLPGGAPVSLHAPDLRCIGQYAVAHATPHRIWLTFRHPEIIALRFLISGLSGGHSAGASTVLKNAIHVGMYTSFTAMPTLFTLCAGEGVAMFEITSKDRPLVAIAIDHTDPIVISQLVVYVYSPDWFFSPPAKVKRLTRAAKRPPNA